MRCQDLPQSRTFLQSFAVIEKRRECTLRAVDMSTAVQGWWAQGPPHSRIFDPICLCVLCCVDTNTPISSNALF